MRVLKFLAEWFMTSFIVIMIFAWAMSSSPKSVEAMGESTARILYMSTLIGVPILMFILLLISYRDERKAEDRPIPKWRDIQTYGFWTSVKIRLFGTKMIYKDDEIRVTVYLYNNSYYVDKEEKLSEKI